MTEIVVQSGQDRIIIKEVVRTVRVVGPPASGATTVSGRVPEKADKDRAPASTSGDNSPTGLTITIPPVGATPYVGVTVNGVGYPVGDGVKTRAAYFSNDAGATAKAFGAITSGDELFWNGVIAGFDLLNSADRVSFDYDT